MSRRGRAALRTTNADWLYQNYLGEYGLPAEVKPLLMRDMRRLANGFAVQLATGRDAKEKLCGSKYLASLR
jgi:hypothetical protein